MSGRKITTKQRSKVWFSSAGVDCAAWHYPGTNGACVVMAGGGGVTKEPGTDPFAARFHDAGFSVLAFDYRRLGESGGTPRQVVRIHDQLADWDAALHCARELPGVDPDKLAGWGFSLSGGHLLRLATKQKLAAVIAQTPLADGLAAAPNALRHETVGVVLAFPWIAMLDVLRGLLRMPPLLVPLAGPRGTIAMLSTPDALDADRALNPGNRYPQWQQTIAARSVMPVGSYRPGKTARRIAVPLLVVAAEQDQTALSGPAVKVAAQAPDAELLLVPGGHYAPFLEQHQVVVDAEIGFLRRRLGVA